MGNLNREGVCHICGKHGKLSFEHVPPRKAFNDKPAFIHSGEELIENSKTLPWKFTTKGRQSQRGMGSYTLCEKCNNETGGWYGGAFVEFAYQSYKFVKGYCLEKGLDAFKRENLIKIHFNMIFPLRIIKQIITMFFSVNSPVFAEVHPDLAKFIKNKKLKGLSKKKYGIYIYILRGKMSRYAGISSMLMLSPKENRVVSEIAAFPFGYVLEINPVGKYRVKNYNILDFANTFDFDQKATFDLEVPIYECNTWYPLDYRSKQQIMKDYLHNELQKISRKSTPG